MTSLAGIFLNNLLPIILVAGAGFAVGKWLDVRPKPVSQLIFNLFLPALVFKLMVESEVPGAGMLKMVIFSALFMLLLGLITGVTGRVLRFERRLAAAAVLLVMFSNAGNYGLPLNLFAFGESAAAYATIFFLTQIVLLYTIGVVIASLGNATLKTALLGLFRIPALYGLALAVPFAVWDIQLPLPIQRPVDLLASAAIPAMLVLLGLQLHTADWRSQPAAVLTAWTLRMLISPLVAVGLSLLLGLQGPARQAGILEAAMPSAILVTVLATEYDVCPPYVNTVVMLTTLLSPLTITPLISYLVR